MSQSAQNYIAAFLAAFGYEPKLTRQGRSYFIETRHGKSPCTFSDIKLDMLTTVLVREAATR